MISVIIPTYNRASMLARAIDSVLAQTEKNYEVIVVDDGSTDETSRVLKGYDGIVRSFRKPNGGCASARNEGIQRARGKYIAFLDSDDAWEPDKLAVQRRILDNNPEVGMVCSDFSCYSKDRFLACSYISTYCPVVRLLGKRFYGYFDIHDEMVYEGVKYPLHKGRVFALELLGYFTLTSTVIIRRECLDVTGTFNTSYQFGSDYELFLRFSFFYPICYIDAPTVRFGRFHQDQLSGSKHARDQMLAQLRMNMEIEKKFPEFFQRNKGLLNWSRSIRFFAVGVASYKKGEYLESMHHFRQSLRYDPWSVRALIYLVRSQGRRLLQMNPMDSHKPKTGD